MELKSHKQGGFGNRNHTVLKDETFNGRVIKKGLKTDGGSIPKIFIISLFLVLKEVYQFHWLTNIIIFAIAIDESNGWFQQPFFLHDQSWQNANCWKDIWAANWLLCKDIIYKVNNYKNEYFIKAFFHMPLGYLLAIVYPLAVATLGVVVTFFKYSRGFKDASE